MGSLHLDGGSHCEFNPGVGVESGDRFRLMGGGYLNSHCDTWSFYAGGRYCVAYSGPWCAGGAVLGLTGYGSPVTAAAALVASYEGKRYGVNLVWFPNKRGDLTNGVIGLQLKRRF